MGAFSNQVEIHPNEVLKKKKIPSPFLFSLSFFFFFLILLTSPQKIKAKTLGVKEFDVVKVTCAQSPFGFLFFSFLFFPLSFFIS